THYSKQFAAGGRLEISNINGDVTVSGTTGRVADVTVTKIVKRGDASSVRVVMEQTSSSMHVCTVYGGSDTCDGNNGGRHHDNSDIETRYDVRVPSGVDLVVDDVNGTIHSTGTDTDAKLETVNGDVVFDGTGASSLQTVNGKVVATFSRASWEGSMEVSTVNGPVDLTFPADLSADLKGETVNGSVDSAFPITVEHGFGPKSFSGRIGAGGRRLNIETVNGSITLRKR
ncbi:MAG: DUF4097 family beta strand repeat-containing protein, partial [Gemmatimonadales bacterium]